MFNSKMLTSIKQNQQYHKNITFQKYISYRLLYRSFKSLMSLSIAKWFREFNIHTL